MADRLKLFACATSGSTAIEYALMATLIGMAIVGALDILFNDSVNGLYNWSTARLLNAISF